MGNDPHPPNDVPTPPSDQPLVQYEGTLVPSTVPNLGELLPLANLSQLTPEERSRAGSLQAAFIILGPAGAGALVCPGNQVGVPDDEKCPYSAKCELLKAHKAPQDELCPIERDYILARFSAWSAELGKQPNVLTESERATISELTMLDTQALRSTSIISKGEAARMTQTNMKEVHPETGDPLSWEKAIHVNVMLLDQLSTRRRMILKEWELTPEMKSKKARWEGKRMGTDLSTQQSQMADRLRRLPPPVIDALPPSKE